MTSMLDEFLGTRSSLTKRQIECLTLHISARNRPEDATRADSLHDITGVSEGSYYRVLSQAKNNVNEALYTLLLCSRIGVLHMEDFERLKNLVAKAPDASESSEEVMSLVGALVSKIVMS